VILGAGDKTYEDLWRALHRTHPSRVGVFIGFDERLAHLIEAGADLFLMPSRFEPCGLNQMYSLRYGTVPVVHGVGGLEDTIQPYTSRAVHANGFKFRGATAAALVQTLKQALRVYREDREAWLALMRQGMAEDHGWDTSAREYVKVYRRAASAADDRRA
jgi:starch synthase